MMTTAITSADEEVHIRLEHLRHGAGIYRRASRFASPHEIVGSVVLVIIFIPMKLALVFASLLLLGCARPWTRPDTTEQEMQRDRDQCERDTKAVGGESFFFERCMFSKGYSEE
jgi:hypothetical protein